MKMHEASVDIMAPSFACIIITIKTTAMMHSIDFIVVVSALQVVYRI